jgi:SMODS-associating 2TM, beta-strand rich effector domain
MHTYTTDSSTFPKIIALLAFAALAVSIALGAVAELVRTNYGYPIGGVSTLAIFGGLYWLTDNKLWRLTPFRQLLRVPDLNGHWLCNGRTTRRDGEARDDSWTAQMTITQTWSRISVTLNTKESESYSTTASVTSNPDGNCRINFQYLNTPIPSANLLARHSGVCTLVFSHEGNNATGSYFTDHGRLTVGEMTLARE